MHTPPHAPIQTLLSLPPRSVAHGTTLMGNRPSMDVLAVADPPGEQLGSGGGTVHVLAEAWRETAGELSLKDWLRASRKLVVHAGGKSRRLPAYAPVGKLATPMPVWRWSVGQRLDQTLLDLQYPLLARVLDEAPSSYVAAVASGDVLLRAAREFPYIPEVDVLCIGHWVRPDQACDFGTFFCPRKTPEKLAFALQKPTSERIRELVHDYVFMVDTGFWLFSARAVDVLFRKCGWNKEQENFADGSPQNYDLYGEFGLALGSAPTVEDTEVSELRCAVIPLPEGDFHHFGKTRDLVTTSLTLQNIELDQRRFAPSPPKPHPTIFTQNAEIGLPLAADNHTVWIENAHVPSSWHLESEHVITGVPHNNWDLQLPKGMCLDIVPLDNGKVCVRTYGMDDCFRGALGDPVTRWLGQPASAWFEERDVDVNAPGLDPDLDIYDAPLFPVVEMESLNPRFIEWMVAVDAKKRCFPKKNSAPRHGEQSLNQPVADGYDAIANEASSDWSRGKKNKASRWRDAWINAERLSCKDLLSRVDISALQIQRSAFGRDATLRLAQHRRKSVFYRLDLDALAKDFNATHLDGLPPLPEDTGDALTVVRDRMFRATVLKKKQDPDWDRFEAEAFALLRKAMIAEAARHPVHPKHQLIEDQIIWARSPVRLDLAGGWTDTPPYCLQHGGSVINLAANLNGQPPIQAFARLIDKPEIILRSIDLGISERIRSFDEIEAFSLNNSNFGIARAALALSGFLPLFCKVPYWTLEEQLQTLGGGLEITLLAAVPKGSGLGTSSILAATLLGLFNDLFALGWDRQDIVQRTLVLEQMLTTGGGWQDQAGGLLPGLKFLNSQPGLAQSMDIKWLPQQVLARENPCIMLYYTGITRVAKGILQDIVRGMFLNSHDHLQLLQEIGWHARHTCEVLERNDWEGFCKATQRSWELNCRLDPGTAPPAVRELLRGVADWLAAAKLLGAGGGGYLLMIAKSPEAAERIRQTLAESPPNARARFVNISVSNTGLQITRS